MYAYSQLGGTGIPECLGGCGKLLVGHTGKYKTVPLLHSLGQLQLFVAQLRQMTGKVGIKITIIHNNKHRLKFTFRFFL